MEKLRACLSIFVTKHVLREYGYKKSASVVGMRFVLNVVGRIYFTFSTMALKAWGLFTARSASTLRLISIPAL